MGVPTENFSHGVAVRRLTPIECERLQGFPDNHTLIGWRGKDADECPDGPRYKAIGNSMQGVKGSDREKFKVGIRSHETIDAPG